MSSPLRQRRRGSALLGLAALVAVGTWCQPTTFLQPLGAALTAGALLAGSPDVAQLDGQSPYYSLDSSSIQVADFQGDVAGKYGGGLDGTYDQKAVVKASDFASDKAVESEDQFAKNFDKNVLLWGTLAFGSFVVPMLQYFWYVRDTDPWANDGGMS